MTTELANSQRNSLLASLAIHTGSETVFRHWTRRLVYTEGVQDLANQAKAYWLIDLVASWMNDANLKGEDFVVWKLTVKADLTASAVAEDGNGRELVRQEIPFTDFPLEEITLYLANGTLLLTSEY
jgi:hypothetical protein